MSKVALVGGTAILPDGQIENATIVFNERIAGIQVAVPSSAEVIDVHGKYVVPGYIDMHVHGGAGADFMDGTPAAVRTACRAHLQHGTTTIFPTTTTGKPQRIMAMIEACRQVAIEDGSPEIPGIHLYGPFFASDKVGCHSQAGRRSPTAAEYGEYFSTEFIRIATCAAELKGAEEFYRTAMDSGCFITCGHSNASWEEMQLAFDAGMRHVDHFWCAMSSVPSLRQRLGVPMQASMAEFVLLNTEMSTEVIADGMHLSPELLEFAYRMLGTKRLCLVTDCNRALDLAPGEYSFGHEEDGSRFVSDGQVGWAVDRSSLASSIVGMDHMVRHMAGATSASVVDAVRMATLTPAERTGLAQDVGSIHVGKRANLLVLDQALEVEKIFLGGKLV